jgi:RHS repeat-associated protein
VGFDGDNAIRVKLHPTPTTPVWRFAQGPGLDDPVVGVYHEPPFAYSRHYFLTDGQGRQYAFTDSLGWDKTGHQMYGRYGGSQAGGIARATTFDNTRVPSVTENEISFYRNRYYDQRTGRFTQEDPIGIAGGMNLYQYAGNNPVMFTDPFGLKVCFKGSEEDVGELKSGAESASGTKITLDKGNCVASWESDGRKGFEELQARFGTMVSSRTTYSVMFDNETKHFSSNWQPAWGNPSNTAVIVREDYQGGTYNRGYRFAPCWLTGGVYDASQSLGGLIAHELLGHGGGASTEPGARGWENRYHAARGEPRRCEGGR